MTEPLNHDHPWPGPDSFRPEDAAFFRGRDSEIKQLLQLIRRTQSVVLFGASGLGKTSLINAGIIPRLAATEHLPVPIRISYVPGAPSVSEQIQAEIAKARHGRGLVALHPHRTVWELLHLRNEPIEDAQPVLIFDQFEELFTIGARTPQAGELVEELKALIEGVPPRSVRDRLERSPEEARTFSFQRKDHRVVLSIREDLLYGLESLRTQLPSIIHNRYRIGPLGGAMAMAVVLQRSSVWGPEAGPQLTGAPIADPDVAELIVRMVSSATRDRSPVDELEVEPALLSILCAELARRRPRGSPVTRELVTGSRADIISSFYLRALAGAPDAVRAYIEDELVTAGGFRTSAIVAEAQAVPGFSDEVLSALVARRLLRVIERQNNKWLELTHDILTEVAVRGRTQRQERQREEMARDQERRARQQRDLRRVRIASAILLVLAMTAVSASALAYQAWRTASEAARLAEQQRQVAEQQRQVADAAQQQERQQRGLAEQSKRDAETQRAITDKTLQAFQRNQQIKQAALSPSGHDYSAQLEKLASELSPSDLQFTANAFDQHKQDSEGRELYYFSLYPRPATIPPDAAFITYLAEYPTFQQTLMVGGRDRRFRVGYSGWGCLTRIVAVVEFTTPTRPPAVSQFDMCAALRWPAGATTHVVRDARPASH